MRLASRPDGERLAVGVCFGYLKNLMGSRRNGAITVSEFVALASPNHGSASTVVACDDLNQPDRVSRQLCGGRRATVASALAACGCGVRSTPPEFATNQAGDLAFLETLNARRP